MDDDGKAVQKLVRRRLFPLASSLCVESQFGGGLNGGEAAIAHLFLRMFVDFVNGSKNSGATICFDVYNAFATLLRPIVFDIDPGGEHWLRSLSSAGFSQDDIAHIYNFDFLGSNESGKPHIFYTLAFNLTQPWYTNWDWSLVLRCLDVVRLWMTWRCP